MEGTNDAQGRFAQQVKSVREYSRIAGVAEIARRYFAMNTFDGVLTTIGVLMGNYLAGVRDLAIPIRTGIATSIAMGVSGLWGAYLTETAERQRELHELERACLMDQTDTKIGRASRLAVVIVAVVDGLAPFLAALVVLVPLFLAGLVGDAVTQLPPVHRDGLDRPILPGPLPGPRFKTEPDRLRPSYPRCWGGGHRAQLRARCTPALGGAAVHVFS